MRLHLVRVHDLLTAGQTKSQKDGASALKPAVSYLEGVLAGADSITSQSVLQLLSATDAELALTDDFLVDASQSIDYIRALKLSGWNPPLPQRKLKGAT